MLLSRLWPPRNLLMLAELLSYPGRPPSRTKLSAVAKSTEGAESALFYERIFPIKKKPELSWFFFLINCNPPSLALCSLQRSTKFQFLMLAIQSWWGRGNKILNIFGKWLLNTPYNYYDFISFLRGSNENEVKDSFICHIKLYYIILHISKLDILFILWFYIS